jgi:hypothetical protein
LPLNPYFNKFNFEPEQRLHQDLVVQMMEIYGHSVYYIPRDLGNYNKIYNTDDQSTYQTIIPTIVYIENIDGFQGQRDIFTRFGLQINDQITLSIAAREFDRVVAPITLKSRPDEGDLIYFTLNKKCFQIKFTNNKEIFYPFGYLPSYQMTLELFQYSDETFNTGIPEIDIIQTNFSMNILDNVATTEGGLIITDEKGNMITDETYSESQIDPIADNQEIETDVETIVDNTTNNVFGFIS